MVSIQTLHRGNLPKVVLPSTRPLARKFAAGRERPIGLNILFTKNFVQPFRVTGILKVAAKRYALQSSKRRPMTSWLFVGALFVLCGVLGVLQYHWIGEVSVAARDALQTALQANLVRLSQDFNSEIVSACRALLPPGGLAEPAEVESEIVSRMEAWKKSSHAQAVRRVAMVVPHNGTAELRMLDSGQRQVYYRGLAAGLEVNRGAVGRPAYPGGTGIDGEAHGAATRASIEVPIFEAAPRMPGASVRPARNRAG